MTTTISLPEPGTHLRKAAGAIAFSPFLFVFLFWLAALHFPGPVPVPALDASWEHALGHALLHRWQAGVDYIFTYGPLGYFAVDPYQDELFWWAFGWEVLVKLVIALLVFTTLSRVQPAWIKWLFLLLFVLLPSDNADLLYPLAIVLLYLAAVRGEPSPLWSAVAAASLCAVFSLMKLTFCILAVVVILALSLNLLVQRRGRCRLLALVPLSVFVMGFAGLWLALGQSAANLPAYFVGSFAVADGYSDAMGVGGNLPQMGLALAILLALAGIVITATTRNTLSFRQLTTMGLLGISLFFQWKHGFVRQDAHHTSNFFSFTLCLAFFLPAAFPEYDWKSVPRLFLLAGAVLLSAIGVVQTKVHDASTELAEFFTRPLRHACLNLTAAVAPESHRSRLQEQLAERKQEYALPRIAAWVGDAPVEYFSSEPGILVLLLNQLNWQPRPAFQSYLAYTHDLLAANARWFQGPSAPAYVVLHLKPIDHRHPCLEDGLALVEILSRYEPVLFEKRHVLLQRRPGADAISRQWKTVCQQRVASGEEIKIPCAPETLQAVTIEVRPSPWGKLRGTLYKPPPVWLQLRTTTGEVLTFRLIPAMASSRFLLNPVVRNNQEVLQLLAGGPTRKVAALTVVAEEEACWAEGFTVTIEESASLPPAKLSAALLQAVGAQPKK
jgi:hypothetical protein